MNNPVTLLSVTDFSMLYTVEFLVIVVNHLEFGTYVTYVYVKYTFMCRTRKKVKVE